VKLPGGGKPEPDWPAANTRKAGIVGNLYKGLQGLLKRRKVNVVIGWGRLTADGAVAVTAEGSGMNTGATQTLSGRAVIICAGSAPRAIPGMDVDGVTVITSDQSTNSDAATLPERVAVIGGGVIGAEFASVFTDLGVSTTLLEALPNPILPLGPDRDVANVLARSLTRRGLTVHGDARVGTLEHTGSGVVVPFETPKGSEKIEVDQVLVSIGRRPVTEDLGAAEAGVRLTDRGFVEVDPTTMLTSRPGVYAVGDCVNTPGLAHVAYAEAVVAVQHFLGENPAPVDYGKVPWVVYTHPEVAWSGNDRGVRQGGRLRRRGPQALDGRQRPRDDPRRDGRPGEDRRPEGRPGARLPHGGPVGERTDARGLPRRELGGAAGRGRPPHPRPPEPVRGHRRNHDHLLRPFPARLSDSDRSGHDSATPHSVRGGRPAPDP
jgi:pyruvate/2-oxoglutarate dehydrogenase complex dihydrolipoamide dehydrogenase (E3) component